MLKNKPDGQEAIFKLVRKNKVLLFLVTESVGNDRADILGISQDL